MNKFLSASLMCADLMRLEKSVSELKEAGIDYLHLDIMDGCFVSNITLGFDLVDAIKSITDVPLDVHMMVNEPSRFIDRMSLDKNDILCVHYESDIHIQRTLAQIRDKGCKTGLALNPQTPLGCMQHLTEYIDMALIMTVSPGFASRFNRNSLTIMTARCFSNSREQSNRAAFPSTVTTVSRRRRQSRRASRRRMPVSCRTP